MKLTSAKIDSVLQLLKSGVAKAVLFYGPDKGLITHCADSIVKSLGHTTFTTTYKEFLEKGAETSLKNTTLFGGKEIIKVTETSQTIDGTLKEVLLDRIQHMPIFIADELSTSSSTRKFFESEDSLIAIGCYPEDENTILRLVSQKIITNGKKISQDALKYFAQNTAGDRGFINSELDKLLLYTNNKAHITLEDVENVVSVGINSSPDNLCIAFVSKNAAVYFNELEKLLLENISAVWVIRALVRYYINLYVVVEKKSHGITLDAAVSGLKPPIFFKYIDAFKKNAATTTKEDILMALRILQKAEIDAKQSVRKATDICELIFFQIHDDETHTAV